jgi:hypothetical protein
MSFRLFVAAIAMTALVLSGCISNPFSGSSETSAAADSASVVEQATAKQASASTKERAGEAALAALDAEVVKVKSDFRLCSLVDEYRMCGGSPCQKGGLKATTYFVCRETQCAGREVLTPDAPTFASHSSCVRGCRKAEKQWRAKKVPLETFYCTY